MQPTPPPDTRETRSKAARSRGSFYAWTGVGLLVGLVLVVGLGVLGITSFGLFSLATAMAMTGLAIGVVALASLITLWSMRRTLKLVANHESVLSEQADRHAVLAARVQAEFKAAQAQRDRHQDMVVAALSHRQDASDLTNAVEAEMNRSERMRAERVRPGAPFVHNGDGDPFKDGDIHPVQDVEGIGEHFAPLLDQMGVTDTEKLWHADTGAVAAALEVSPLVVAQWKGQCELMAVDGIGKQYAELVVRAGVSSIGELAAHEPDRLLDRIGRLEARVGKPIQGNRIGIKVVESWIASARSHHDHRSSAKVEETAATGSAASAPTGGW